MMKKIISLTLCLLMLIPVFASCSGSKDPNDQGAYISMYITEPVYNFDPARAYGNEAALKVVGLLFDTLFVLDDNGKVKKSLAKDYEIIEKENDVNPEKNEYKMIITINENTKWSNNTALTADDVVFAWRRILDPENSFEAAALLYDVINAREAKEGDASIDDVGFSAINDSQIEIRFVGKIDYDRFLLNLTSYALAPLKETVVKQAVNPFDWAKKPSIFATSGPFSISEISYAGETEGIVLERNPYYRRNAEKDKIDKSVTPYKLVVDFTMTDEELMTAYSEGKIFYVGNIPFSVRGDWKDEATITDALSTHSYAINQNAIVRYYNEKNFGKLTEDNAYNAKLKEGKDGEKIFAIQEVREALSLAIDRDDIAKKVVFAKAATALVPDGIFNTNNKKDTFREEGGAILKTSANIDAAKKLLKDAKVDANKFMFTISVPAYDEVHIEIANMVKKSWEELGFHVAVCEINLIDNVDKDKTTNETIIGIKDDVFAERYTRGEYEVAAIDYTAYSVDAFSMLAPFATHFTGNAATDGKDFFIPKHTTGYDSEDYNKKIESAHKAKTTEKRTKYLHEAEEILMEELPIIPIVFNMNATLMSKELSKADVSYYGVPIFTELKLKNYEEYLPESETESVVESESDSETTESETSAK